MRNVLPGCDIEGQILEAARKKKKEAHARYTQDYVAELAGKGQYVWTQWKQGTLRISDWYWLVFALELDFNPFETRPELRDLAQMIHQADTRFSRESTGSQFDALASQLDPNQAALVDSLIRSLASSKSAHE